MTKSLSKVEKDLQEKIDATLTRYKYGIDTTSDGYDILRWARQGLLTRKVENEAT